MLSVSIILKIAGVGILVSALHGILKEAGKENYAFYATLAGILIVFLMLIDMIGQFYDNVKSVFQLY